MFNTYEKQKELVEAGLAKCSTNGEIDTFKYSRKVMYDYLWDTDVALMEVRGHSYSNKTGKLVIAAPRKSFNYLENGHWKGMPLDEPVVAYTKFNGFLALVSNHNGEVVVSTTGSTKSDFVKMATDMLNRSFLTWNYIDDAHTYLYEIIHPDDPHIVKEDIGAEYLGCRNKNTGVFNPIGVPYEGTLKGILAIAKVNQGEGFMVYQKSDVDCLNPCKIKTPYYVGKKLAMRMSKKSVEQMYSNSTNVYNKLPNYWKFLPELITKNYSLNDWLDKTDQERRIIIENFDEQRTKTMLNLS